ncbi:hypothetical protein ACFQY5_39235 [Paeniroseomonas aquatica]|uniref:hypothetical protein n=1 Tax=Paeniroseomonas aquatica TaxID=373043 RepID=UPI00361CAF67
MYGGAGHDMIEGRRQRRPPRRRRRGCLHRCPQQRERRGHRRLRCGSGRLRPHRVQGHLAGRGDGHRGRFDPRRWAQRRAGQLG